MAERTRLDQALQARGLTPSRARARDAILRGTVQVNGVVASKPNKIIADILGISIKTVELHRANMMNKLGVRSLPELMKVALGND